MRGFDHIFGNQFTSEQNNNNEHSKYVEILISIEQHSNCRQSSAASPVSAHVSTCHRK